MTKKIDEVMEPVNIKASLLPNTGIDDYYLWIYPDVPERCTKGFVGFVGSNTNPDIKIKIEIDHQWMFDNNYVTLAFWANVDNYNESEIVMTPRYFDEFRRNPYLQFDLWHEIGHYHTLHYFDSPHNENGSANASRIEYFERGDIMPEEKAADIFGLYYTSKDDAIRALSESIRRRRTYTWEPQETTQRAVEEFRRRKRFLRDLDTDEKAREALCKLCGKENYLEI